MPGKSTQQTVAHSIQLKKVQTAYRVLAPGYDWLRPLWAGGILGSAEHFLEREILPQHCPPGGVVLDLGCGTGANLERILRMGIPISRYAGVDISPAMLRCARRKFSWFGSAEFYLSNLERLPFNDNTFDFAICTWAMEHVPQVKLAVDEALRVLKRGACLVLLSHSLPNLPWRIPVYLIEPIFRLVFQMRFLGPRDYSSSDSKKHILYFAKGLHTLHLFTTEAAT